MPATYHATLIIHQRDGFRKEILDCWPARAGWTGIWSRGEKAGTLCETGGQHSCKRLTDALGKPDFLRILSKVAVPALILCKVVVQYR